MKKSGRRLVPTEMGQLTYQYQTRFCIGSGVDGRPEATLNGQSCPAGCWHCRRTAKEIAQELIPPALHLPKPVVLHCHEANLEALMARLAIHEVDLVLSDAPVTPTLNVCAFNHIPGETGVVLIGLPFIAKQYRRNFPKSLDGGTILLPTDDTAIRQSWTASLIYIRYDPH